MKTVGDGAGYEIVHEFPEHAIEGPWREFLRRANLPSHYTTPEFFLEPFWDGMHPFAVLARQGREVTGVLTGVHQNNQVISGLRVSPQVCVDASADPARTADALVRGLLAEAGRAGLVTLFCWSWAPLDILEEFGFVRRETPGSVILDLGLGADVLFERFSQERRRNIRLAIRRGVEVSRASTPEDFAAYYEVRKRWEKTPRKIVSEEIDRQLFERIFRLRDNRCLLLAKFSGKVIAGGLLRFSSGGLIEYSGNASLDEHLKVKPNDLLQWRAIEWACREGFPRYSFGGISHFHSGFGGERVPVIRYRLDKTWLRRHDLQEKVGELARSCLRRLPTSARTIARRFGRG